MSLYNKLLPLILESRTFLMNLYYILKHVIYLTLIKSITNLTNLLLFYILYNHYEYTQNLLNQLYIHIIIIIYNIYINSLFINF